MPAPIEPLHFTPAPPTQLLTEADYAQLLTVDLSTFDDGPEARQELAETVRQAMTQQGFFYLENMGISKEEIDRQVDIGYTVLSTTPAEEKQQLKCAMIEEGTYKGFKLRGHYKGAGGVGDRIEQFNWYRDMASQEFPSSILPFFDEVKTFTAKVHTHVFFRLLQLLAIALKVPENTFVDKHKFDVHDETWARYMAFYDEHSEEEEKLTKGVWLGGHQDFGTLTLLFSQPMAALQVRLATDDSIWQFVKHRDGAMVINAGEFLEWYTGGYFKAAVHRVSAPPKDQRGYTRVGVFYFTVPNDDENVDLIEGSPVLEAAGAKPREVVLTSKQYTCARIQRIGQSAIKTQEGKVTHENIEGVKTPWFG